MLPRRDFLLMLVCCATLCAAAAPSQVHAKDGGKDSGGNDNSGKDDGGDDGDSDNSGKDDGGDDDGDSDNSGKDDGGDDGDNSGKDDGGDDSGKDDSGDDDSGKDDDGGKNRNDDRQKTLSHNEALKEKKTGDVIPLERALKIIAGKFEGKVIDVKLTRSFGRQQYRVKLRAKTGVIKTVRLDAKTGRFIGFLGF